MTARRKTAKGTHKHVTAHRRALADPIVVKLIAGIRKRWKAKDGIERGDRLRELVALGCSARGLGKDLRLSATTIRRHIELATLPAKGRDAVKAGASAKKILASKAIDDRRRRRKQRIDGDRRSGLLSDEVAGIILEFCRAQGEPSRTAILEAEFTMFMNSVAYCLQDFGVHGQRGIKATKIMGIAGLFEQTQPRALAGTFWMDYQAEWLANIVLAKAPEPPIWERSLTKAQKRAAELNVEDMRTPLEAYDDNEARLAEIRFGPNNRLVYPGGASRMLRQGRKPIS